MSNSNLHGMIKTTSISFLISEQFQALLAYRTYKLTAASATFRMFDSNHTNRKNFRIVNRGYVWSFYLKK